MDKYVSRDDVRRFIADAFSENRFATNYDYAILVDEIDELPAADVQSIRHGRWITVDDVEHFIAVCSECGRTEDSRDIKDMPYCHCGARMDLKDGDTNG